MRKTKASGQNGEREKAMNGGEWLDALVDWLEGFAWQWFCTLTFRPGLSPAQAGWRLIRWADELRVALGTANFEWIGIPEHGVTGLHFHYHALVGGLVPGCGAAERLVWMKRWHKLAGDARITDFKPDCGGVRYVVKSVQPNDFDQIEFHLTTPAKIKSSTKQKTHS